ncbi:MAG: L-aspartate oxidase [Rikenellaceae bacterium]|nr:L-aspartate oxidase [Rikenellaceae bacterium]MDE7355598.1 L-aspartate oxidase [Rikenellaceae bacterium]
MNKECDFLIVGSGAAGLVTALKAAEHGHVIVVTKSDMSTTNTAEAQGGIASVTYPPDNFDKHIRDTMTCGSNECDPEAVRIVVEGAPDRIKDLVGWGVDFDKSDGRYDLAREGGHSEHRILHHKDSTGREIEEKLVMRVREHPNIEVLEYHFAIDLLTQHHLGQLVRKSTPSIECYGAYVLNLKDHTVFTVLSKVTVLATGGVGNLYNVTTNPPVATGDGIAMAHRAKAVVENMEFIQFHPTALYNPGERPSFLITEAMRGFGAVLRTQDGAEFMDRYHPMGSLAPRDIVSRAIDNELKSRGEDFVYLDVTHRPADSIIEHFPNIYAKCLTIGIDITRDMIPVAPAAHYCCGGVKVDGNGQTTINRLYAIGETSSTGLHGANRLASNSLIEAVVYAHRAAEHAVARIGSLTLQRDIPDWDYEGTSIPEELVLVTQSYKELQQIMNSYVGIVRSDMRLERAFRRLEIIFRETEELYKTSTLSRHLCELRNMIAVAYLIIKQAKEMKQSVGLHYTIDYPAPGINAKEF